MALQASFFVVVFVYQRVPGVRRLLLLLLKMCRNRDHTTAQHSTMQEDPLMTKGLRTPKPLLNINSFRLRQLKMKGKFKKQTLRVILVLAQFDLEGVLLTVTSVLKTCLAKKTGLSPNR